MLGDKFDFFFVRVILFCIKNYRLVVVMQLCRFQLKWDELFIFIFVMFVWLGCKQSWNFKLYMNDIWLVKLVEVRFNDVLYKMIILSIW